MENRWAVASVTQVPALAAPAVKTTTLTVRTMSPADSILGTVQSNKAPAPAYQAARKHSSLSTLEGTSPTPRIGAPPKSTVWRPNTSATVPRIATTTWSARRLTVPAATEPTNHRRDAYSR
jgi:hypothetical protein